MPYDYCIYYIINESLSQHLRPYVFRSIAPIAMLSLSQHLRPHVFRSIAPIAKPRQGQGQALALALASSTHLISSQLNSSSSLHPLGSPTFTPQPPAEKPKAESRMPNAECRKPSQGIGPWRPPLGPL